jgi:hypothetical protein
MPDPVASRRVTFPLALLFLVVTGAAIIAALIGPLLRDIDWSEVEIENVVGGLIASVIGGSILGGLLGLFQYNRLVGVAVGLCVGATIGPVALLVTTVPTSKVSSVVPAVCIGSGILLLIAWLIRPPAQVEEPEEIVAATLVSETKPNE